MNQKNFYLAWNEANLEARNKWRSAIKKELNSMEDLKVWEEIDLKDKPADRKLVGNRWVLKIKRDGSFRARLVALGYSQEPGLDFIENYSPVVSDVSFRLMLVMIQQYGLKPLSLDVETAFLHGQLDEEIYMKIPQGLPETTGKNSDGKCLRLRKAMYGLVQAARQWHKRFEEVILSLNFEKNQIDPCLFIKGNNQKEMCFISLYVDDCILAGDQKMMQEPINHLNESFKIKIKEGVDDFLGCEINLDEGTIKQKRIIGKLLDVTKNSELVRNYNTPLPGGYLVTKPDKDSTEIMSGDQQKLYRSALGSRMYLVKLSKSELSNCMRELSKVMDLGTVKQFKSLMRVVKYVSETENIGLKIKPNIVEPWKIEVFADSDFCGDRNTRKSVTGYVVFVNDVAVSWKSKSQRNISLSSTEAEYVAVSEATRETKFIMNLLESVNVKYKKPVKIRIDNIGAIFLVNNRNTSERTRHIDTRYHYVRNLIDDGSVIIEFINSKDNIADIFTKNLSDESYNKHNKYFRGE